MRRRRSDSRRTAGTPTIGCMILGDESRGEHPGPRRSGTALPEAAAELRQMALHLETAAVLDLRARRTADPAQVAVLQRRAEQRRQQAARIRARLAATGAAMPEPAPAS
jgi:hypothetical protein